MAIIFVVKSSICISFCLCKVCRFMLVEICDTVYFMYFDRCQGVPKLAMNDEEGEII